MKLNGPPSPEEFQKRLNEWMKNFQGSGGVGNPFGSTTATPQSEPPTAAEEEEPQPPANQDILEFDKTPKELKSYLDRYVIRQDEAKKALSVAICDHYHHVRQTLIQQEETAKRNPNTTPKGPRYAKQNILLLGPTGVGKTYLVRTLADLIGVPFVKADATKFSETGYVGSDVEDLVRDLVRQADGDIERAQYGIVYIDEIDKIARADGKASRDVSGRGVQINLLKLMEETDVSIRSQNDLAGQMAAMMDMQRGKKSASTINTRHILFIVSGAFDGLDEVVRRRRREAAVGFGASVQGRDDWEPEALMEQSQTRDFIEYGFEPEFIGRLPVRVVCQPLSVDDLFEILDKSEDSLIRQYESSFEAYGIHARFKEDAMRRIAELAADEKTGARGLMTVAERALRGFKFELPSTHIRALEVGSELIDSPEATLKTLLSQEKEIEARQRVEEISRMEQKFEEEHGIKIRFTDDARSWILDYTEGSSKSVGLFLKQQFKDLHFGLKLIAKNTGKQEYDLPLQMAQKPDPTLSLWLIESYRVADAPNKPDNSDNVG
jgi:ATP-dependent Clp protease ATP-binding subunit ClpX